MTRTTPSTGTPQGDPDEPQPTTSPAAAPAMSVSPFTDADAIRLGGWSPAHAQALAVASDDVVAAALVDTNGDGRHLDLGIYRRVDDAWVMAAEWTDVARRPQHEEGERIEVHSGGDLDAGADDGGAAADNPDAAGLGREAFTACVINWGRARPNSDVVVELIGDWVTVKASPLGWWVAVRADAP